jgi:methylated-DNA-[protein]-cysteine S-methyltransferase
MNLRTGTLDTPIGPITLVVGEDDGKLRELRLPRPGKAPRERTGGRVPRHVASALAAYFAGKLDAIDAIEIEPEGTPLFRHIWSVLRRVPAGDVVSYSELARRSGRPKAVRAAAMANARNPIAIVVPCHRVIGANGHLWGYGGGLEMKRTLLTHEGVPIGDDLRVFDLIGRAGTR